MKQRKRINAQFHHNTELNPGVEGRVRVELEQILKFTHTTMRLTNVELVAFSKTHFQVSAVTTGKPEEIELIKNFWINTILDQFKNRIPLSVPYESHQEVIHA